LPPRQGTPRRPAVPVTTRGPAAESRVGEGRRATTVRAGHVGPGSGIEMPSCGGAEGLAGAGGGPAPRQTRAAPASPGWPGEKTLAQPVVLSDEQRPPRRAPGRPRNPGRSGRCAQAAGIRAARAAEGPRCRDRTRTSRTQAAAGPGGKRGEDRAPMVGAEPSPRQRRRPRGVRR